MSSSSGTTFFLIDRYSLIDFYTSIPVLPMCNVIAEVPYTLYRAMFLASNLRYDSISIIAVGCDIIGSLQKYRYSLCWKGLVHGVAMYRCRAGEWLCRLRFSLSMKLTIHQTMEQTCSYFTQRFCSAHVHWKCSVCVGRRVTRWMWTQTKLNCMTFIKPWH